MGHGVVVGKQSRKAGEGDCHSGRSLNPRLRSQELNF